MLHEKIHKCLKNKVTVVFYFGKFRYLPKYLKSLNELRRANFKYFYKVFIVNSPPKPYGEIDK